MNNSMKHSEDYKYLVSLLRTLADNFYERPLDEKYQAVKDVTITLTPLSIASEKRGSYWSWKDVVEYEMDLKITRADVGNIDMLLLIESVKQELIVCDLKKYLSEEMEVERQGSEEKNHLHYKLRFSLTSQLEYPCV